MKPPEKMMALNKMSPRLTSYEMVCATARRAPIRAYFELEAHPEPKVEYTARLERAKIKRMPRFKSAIGKGRGIGTHSVRASIKARTGARRNRRGEAVEGRTGSFVRSLSPSAKG